MNIVQRIGLIGFYMLVLVNGSCVDASDTSSTNNASGVHREGAKKLKQGPEKTVKEKESDASGVHREGAKELKQRPEKTVKEKESEEKLNTYAQAKKQAEKEPIISDPHKQAYEREKKAKEYELAKAIHSKEFRIDKGVSDLAKFYNPISQGKALGKWPELNQAFVKTQKIKSKELEDEWQKLSMLIKAEVLNMQKAYAAAKSKYEKIVADAEKDDIKARVLEDDNMSIDEAINTANTAWDKIFYNGEGLYIKALDLAEKAGIINNLEYLNYINLF